MSRSSAVRLSPPQVSSHAVKPDLAVMVERHGLFGAMLVTFEDDGTHISTESPNAIFGRSLDEMAARILEAVRLHNLNPATPFRLGRH